MKAMEPVLRRMIKASKPQNSRRQRDLIYEPAPAHKGGGPFEDWKRRMGRGWRLALGDTSIS